MRFSKTAFQAQFADLFPSFLIGLAVFLGLILVVQGLRITEIILAQGLTQNQILTIIMSLCLSFLPIILPMSLLFSILLTYGRLSQDSELMALRSAGLNLYSIGAPAFLFTFLISFSAWHLIFSIAPWGNRQFEKLVSQADETQVLNSLRQGTFSEGFFDLVVYANSIDPKSGTLQQVFLYDDRNGETPLTIIAQRGRLIKTENNPVVLKLEDGDIHRKAENHTKIRFKEFDIELLDPRQVVIRQKSTQSLSYDELQTKRHLAAEKSEANPESDELKSVARDLLIEWHRRWNLGVVNIVFGILGVGLGSITNRRSKASGGFIMSLLIIIVYWVTYVSLESVARKSGNFAVLYLPNFIFFLIGVYSLRRANA